MVFSTSSRNVRLEHDANTDLTYLRAECKTDSGEWNSSSICLDEHLGVSQENKGFDSGEGKTASAQKKSLQSLLQPGSLTLYGISVLHGIVSGMYGGNWEATIYLDLLFNNNNGQLVREARSNSLMKTAGLIKPSEDGDITSLLLTSDGKLAFSQFSIEDCCAFDDRGRVKPRDPDDNLVLYVREVGGYYAHIGGQASKPSGYDWRDFDIKFEDQLSNSNGRISLEPPSEYVDDQYPPSCHLEHKQGLVSLGLSVTGADALKPVYFEKHEKTRATAQCIYTSTILAGHIVGFILFGKIGAGYGPGLASLTGFVVQSATGPFVSDPQMRDEVAAVAIYRALKEEVANATGVGIREVMEIYWSSSFDGGYEDFDDCPDKLKSYAAEEFSRQGVDSSILNEMTPGWNKYGNSPVEELTDTYYRIIDTVVNALKDGMSEDDIKHAFDDHTHDGVDLLPRPPSPSPPPPPEKKDGNGTDYIGKWTQDIVAVQDQLYLLEPSIGPNAEQSTTDALEAIANGLTGLNKLLDFWPDYTGDDATNEQRITIINSTMELVATGSKTVTDTEEDTSVLDQVLKLEAMLNSLKSQFMDETTAENVELDKLKAELQGAVEKMFADQKTNQQAQNELLAKLNQIKKEEHNHGVEATIEGGIRWYKDFLRRRTSALATFQSAVTIASAAYLESEQIVVHMQARQAVLNDTHKRRFAVQNEISKAQMIVECLKVMIEGTKQEEKRILFVVDLMMGTTLPDLLHIGEPPYHRPNRKIEDQLCTAVLAAHRESLIDASFVESARKAVATVQDWFGDDMPKATQQEIDAIVKNPVYKP